MRGKIHDITVQEGLCALVLVYGQSLLVQAKPHYYSNPAFVEGSW